MLWQGFLAYGFSTPLQPAGRLVLFLTVWAIYLADRLLDARKPPTQPEPARHRYYRRHSNFSTALLAVVVVSDAAIATLRLRPAILRDGLIPLAGVLLYLVANHFAGKSIAVPKEIAAALLFTGGTFVAAWAVLPCPQLAWAACAFFVLCLANMIAIEAWETREPQPHPLTRWLARTYLVWVPGVVIVCILLGRNAWYDSIAVSAARAGGWRAAQPDVVLAPSMNADPFAGRAQNYFHTNRASSRSLRTRSTGNTWLCMTT